MNNIKLPTLIIDTQKAGRNIKKMAEKARLSNAVFRPHFKTHQSAEVANLFKKYGVNKITVSSVSMALFFAQQGWNDITVAFPFNILEVNTINQLAIENTINLLVESEYVTRLLLDNLKYPVGLFIKIDTGYHRTGLPANSTEIEKIITLVSQKQNVRFKGFLTHAGHSYHARSKDEILSIADNAKIALNRLKQRYIIQFSDIVSSYGDTPSCSTLDNCTGFDEIRPGNFVFYDVMQYHLGSCHLNEISVVVACPVVAVHSDREEVVIYGGAVHLSKECIEADQGFKLYGYVVRLSDSGWGEPIKGAYVSGLSQEHGMVKFPAAELAKVKPGNILGILPVHSCLTANLLKEQVVLKY